MITAAPAFAGIVPGRGIGRGRNTVGPAVTHPAVHALPAFPASVMLSFVAQTPSSEKLCTTPHGGTAILALRPGQTMALYRGIENPFDQRLPIRIRRRTW